MRGYKLVLLPLFFISSLLGQGKFHFEFGMDSLIMNVGESKEVTIKLLNENGKLAQIFISGSMIVDFSESISIILL
jgi:hypothetical protein